jgi:hypothetical protein
MFRRTQLADSRNQFNVSTFLLSKSRLQVRRGDPQLLSTQEQRALARAMGIESPTKQMDEEVLEEVMHMALAGSWFDMKRISEGAMKTA